MAAELPTTLGGGFKDFSCSPPILREMIPIWLAHMFSDGWLNHQLVEPRNSSGGHILAKRLEPHCGSKRKTPTWQHSSLVGIEVGGWISQIFIWKMVGNHHVPHPFQRGWFFFLYLKDSYSIHFWMPKGGKIFWRLSSWLKKHLILELKRGHEKKNGSLLRGSGYLVTGYM